MSNDVKFARPLPRFVLDMLAACPGAGAGVHNWLFRVARVLHPFYADKHEMAALIAGAAAGCGRDVPQGEIEAAIANSEACAWRPGAKQQGTKPQPSSRASWPLRNDERIEAVIAASEVCGLVDLWEASPMRFEDAPATEELIDALFPGDPLLCCGLHVKHDYGTGTREEWRGQLARQQFIVPSPMTAEEGHRKTDGKPSLRTLENTGPRRFLVIEFDHGTFDSHAAVLWHLARLAPLVMAVHSGGKSLHGWFACAGADEETLLRFMRYAVALGADPITWTRCQFVRMPDGLRRRPDAFPVRQQVFHFNPHNLP